ncbi:MAG: hypothetical protein NE330_01315 [Lentisphaeraceae bacterium]|nr:hypothetical protein [Lentisphaeraceae bacterium]
MKKFTVIELLIVAAIIAILASILIPSLHKAREKALFAVCTSNRGQVYKAMYMGMDDNKEVTPRFIGWNNTNPSDPDWFEDDWSGAVHGQGGKLVNGVVNRYIDYSKISRCPSLHEGVAGDKVSSNGFFDYSYLQSFGNIQIYKLPSTITWAGNSHSMPLILEEDPFYINGSNRESGFGNNDFLGMWHDFGKKGGYLGIDGSSVIVRNNGVKFRSKELYMDYQDKVGVALSDHKALEDWPRPF